MRMRMIQIQQQEGRRKGDGPSRDKLKKIVNLKAKIKNAVGAAATAALISGAAAGLSSCQSIEVRERPPEMVIMNYSYKVKNGDTFESIAKKELGDEKRSADIRSLNPDIDPKKLIPGTKIAIPGR